MTDDDNREKSRERTDNVFDVLGREVPEMKMEQRWDSKGLRGPRSLFLLCWESNWIVFILVSMSIQCGE